MKSVGLNKNLMQCGMIELLLCCILHLQILYVLITMSSCVVVAESGMFPYVVFGGQYRCLAPSVAEAVQATEIDIDGIAGVGKHQYVTRVYPRGRFCCGECGEWKVLDVINRAWAIRSTDGSCPFVRPSLVCEDCSELDAFSQGCRFAVFAHEDFYRMMREDAKQMHSKMIINKWRLSAKLHKERREFALNSALVFKGSFDERSECWLHAWRTFFAHTRT